MKMIPVINAPNTNRAARHFIITFLKILSENRTIFNREMTVEYNSYWKIVTKETPEDPRLNREEYCCAPLPNNKPMRETDKIATKNMTNNCEKNPLFIKLPPAFF